MGNKNNKKSRAKMKQGNNKTLEGWRWRKEKDEGRKKPIKRKGENEQYESVACKVKVFLCLR